MDNKRNLNWLNDSPPWEMGEKEFVDLHYTGHISSGSYEQYEAPGGLAWLGSVAKYPLLEAVVNGVEYRRTGEQLQYVAIDEAGEIIRGKDGMATYMSAEQIEKKNLAKVDQTIVAFVDAVPIGFVANEFGAVGVWVEREHQRKGIGVNLLKRFLDENRDMRIGQMTNAGLNAVARLHSAYVAESELRMKAKKTFKP